jgi:hypothetical protein
LAGRAASVLWRADPHDGSVFLFLTHNIVEPEQFARGIGFRVYAAIARFQAVASTPGE